MTYKIFKYQLGPGKNIVMMPEMSIPLTVQVQYDQPMLWALVDTDKKDVERTFHVFPTGRELQIDFCFQYISTFQLNGGALVFHVFEEHNFS